MDQLASGVSMLAEHGGTAGASDHSPPYGTAYHRLISKPEPPTTWGVLDESALLRQFVGATVMREQTERLIEVSQLPYVRVQALPQDAQHPVNTSSFIHLRLPEFQDVVYLEHLHSARRVEEPLQVHGYALVFDHLRSEALGPDASRELTERSSIRSRPRTWAGDQEGHD
ncbi:hypothetical protein DP939_42995 [Spongiactinospora rosea]|uniref:DUF5753 domain-containing protein n=1 Tax=Spongiactinospora rosea TaxID=2248750 RepID=A0A366LKY2_9ACTN|nr:DUF5753 domain-containing protein [Spongiactinospora rosea]RBQ13954.1 hypothetical protein DP939_42995 [Spongiactinospora rosea]